MVCESIILMPPWTQYLPIAGISPTDPWISQTDDERTVREARMSTSSKNFEKPFEYKSFKGKLTYLLLILDFSNPA